jgi:transcriptional regulator with XRE-family HTH domain
LTLTGEHIRTARQLLGWSQIALAVRAGVGINQLKNFESGVTAPRSATIAALRRRLETANVQFIAKNRGGAGVRLLTASDGPRRSLFAGRIMPVSDVQASILKVLPTRNRRPIPSSIVFERLGVQRPTRAQRASLSRSLARLAERGSAQRWSPDAYLCGGGYLWSRA